jgi:hypothetical protein
MFRSSLIRLSIVVTGLSLVFGSLSLGAQQEKPRHVRKLTVPPPSARVEITVVKDVNGKPILNAAVIFHPIEGDRDKGGMELKTNEDGKAVIDVLPMGDTVRMQIFARGFQTYGIDYVVDKPEIVMEIRMKRPGEQYSIYKKHDGTPDAGKGASADKPATPPADAAKPATDSKPDAQANPSPAPKQ